MQAKKKMWHDEAKQKMWHDASKKKKILILFRSRIKEAETEIDTSLRRVESSNKKGRESAEQINSLETKQAAMQKEFTTLAGEHQLIIDELQRIREAEKQWMQEKNQVLQTIANVQIEFKKLTDLVSASLQQRKWKKKKKKYLPRKRNF